MTLERHIDTIFTVIKSLQLSRSIFKTEADYNHQSRLQVDPFIYTALRELYGKQLQEFWNTTTTIPERSDKAIVIVERRCHPNLQFCLQNAAYFARGYSIHIFCSLANHSFIKSICGSKLSNIYIYPIFETIGTPEEGKIEYNTLLKSIKFWNVFQEEHILTIETDSYFLKPIPESVYGYDYVACKWPWLPNEPGGGGLSYRKCSLMRRICELEDASVKDDPMQDSFASNGARILFAKSPTLAESMNYFTECALLPVNSIGTHQWWTFISSLDDTTLQKTIRYYLTLIGLN